MTRGTALAFLVLVGLAGSLRSQDENWLRAQRVFDSSSRPVEALASLARTHDRDPWAHYFHGRALAEAKDLGAAEAALARAAALAPEEGFVVGERASVVARRGDLERARDLYVQARARARKAGNDEQVTYFAERGARLDALVSESSDRRLRLVGGLAGAILVFVTGLVLLRRRLR